MVFAVNKSGVNNILMWKWYCINHNLLVRWNHYLSNQQVTNFCVHIYSSNLLLYLEQDWGCLGST